MSRIKLATSRKSKTAPVITIFESVDARRGLDVSRQVIPWGGSTESKKMATDVEPTLRAHNIPGALRLRARGGHRGG